MMGMLRIKFWCRYLFVTRSASSYPTAPITCHRLFYDLPDNVAGALRRCRGSVRRVGLHTPKRGVTASSTINRDGPLLRRGNVAGANLTRRIEPFIFVNWSLRAYGT